MISSDICRLLDRGRRGTQHKRVTLLLPLHLACTPTSITTIRLSDERRARIETVAAARGSSIYTFMLEAIAEVIERVERRQDFEAEAQRRWKKMLRTGRVFDAGGCTVLRHGSGAG